MESGHIKIDQMRKQYDFTRYLQLAMKLLGLFHDVISY